jgi:hypothetical protein
VLADMHGQRIVSQRRRDWALGKRSLFGLNGHLSAFRKMTILPVGSKSRSP